MQVKQQCSPGASTSLLDVLFALEGMQVSESEKPVCDVHWHFYKSPYPTALEWHKASVCIIQRRKKVIFEYCVIITGDVLFCLPPNEQNTLCI